MEKERVMNKWSMMAIGLGVFVLTVVTFQAQEHIDSVVIRRDKVPTAVVVWSDQ